MKVKWAAVISEISQISCVRVSPAKTSSISAPVLFNVVQGAEQWLGYPNLDLLSHNSGHLWSTLLGETGDPHFGVLHIASYVFLGFGFYLLSSAWNVLYHAQRRSALATSGPYARIRHPQYVAFVLILLGFLLQWPTLLTLVMFPVLLVMYGRLAITEEAEMRKQFGADFDTYAARTPRFFPAWRKSNVSTGLKI